MADNELTEENIKAILKEVESGAELSELCRKYDITPSELHLWKLKYGEPEPGEAVAKTDPALRIMRWTAAALLAIGLGLWLWSGYYLIGGPTGPPMAETTGKIVTSERVRLTGEQGTVKYEYKIAYDYKVDDKQYTSQRIRFGPTSAKDYEELKVGREVKVFYDKRQPGVAVLEREIPPDVFEPFRLGFYWLGAAFVVGCLAWWYGDKLVES
ncbi:MAG TPA: DUF3592 domain-containing protein [Candidatus Obscuribacterales bacterium]